MKIENIKVKNFRSLEDINISFKGNYCAISGCNNCGKSNIIHLIANLLQPDSFPFWENSPNFVYARDYTQWKKNKNENIEVVYSFLLSSTYDAKFIEFIKKFANPDSAFVSLKEYNLTIKVIINQNNKKSYQVTLQKNKIEPREVIERLRTSRSLILHNSTQNIHAPFIDGRKYSFTFIASDEDKNAISNALEKAKKDIKRISSKRSNELNEYLKSLNDSIGAEISLPDVVLGHYDIILKDSTVQVPLDSWGSGTQNRTAILMSIMNASKHHSGIVTPIIIIEEPESFLHPSAQAEFGKIIRKLSQNDNLQIIVTTHSPHMLNIDAPECNILLSKISKRKLPPATIVEDTSGDEWMKPYAEHLGLDSSTFKVWSPFIGKKRNKVLLVEGVTDQKYLSHLQSNDFPCGRLNPDIEIIPYEGKDALKNTKMLSFILKFFDRFFILFDKDAEHELLPSLSTLKLEHRKHFISVGLNESGKDKIEGLLPQKIVKKVVSDNPDLILKLQSSNDRRSASSELKKLYCEEFCSVTDYTEEDLVNFSPIVTLLNKVFK